MRHVTPMIALCFAASMALATACASDDESDIGASPKKDAGKEAAAGGAGAGGSGGGTGGGGGGIGGSGGSGTGGTGNTSSGGTDGGTGATGGGGTGGGSCNVDFCPTPAPPATKCCVTANGPCGVDYGQGCQGAGAGGSGP